MTKPLPALLRNKPDLYAVLGVQISRGHDFTSGAALGHFESELSSGTRRYATWAQYWVQRFNVRDAHMDVTVLKTRPTGEGGLPTRLEI